MADTYQITLGQTVYTYKCICHKDWHDLQLILLDIAKLNHNEPTAEEQLQMIQLNTDVEILEASYLQKYVLEPNISDIAELDQSVYMGLIRAILDKAIPKNSPTPTTQ